MWKFLKRYISTEWILKVILNFLCMPFFYVTTPLAVLFANEKGKLPKLLSWWQTYDNTLDVEWVVTKKLVWNIFLYDFNKHYKYIYEYKADGIMEPGYVIVLDPHFTISEKIKRYGCRVYWLWRNCGYGFAYTVLGKEIDPTRIVVVVDTKELRVMYIPNTGLFSIHSTEQWYCRVLNKNFRMNIYLGWKFAGTVGYKNKTRVMIANRYWPFRSVE